jgi:hypothetical protein
MKRKPKKYAEGGLAGLAENAQSLMDDVDSMASSINYGTNTQLGGSSSGTELFGNKFGFKKGGTVKSSASKRADGCAVRGKTKGRMV